jgi:hypothetical protein
MPGRSCSASGNECSWVAVPLDALHGRRVLNSLQIENRSMEIYGAQTRIEVSRGQVAFGIVDQFSFWSTSSVCRAVWWRRIRINAKEAFAR